MLSWAGLRWPLLWERLVGPPVHTQRALCALGLLWHKFHQCQEYRGRSSLRSSPQQRKWGQQGREGHVSSCGDLRPLPVSLGTPLQSSLPPLHFCGLQEAPLLACVSLLHVSCGRLWLWSCCHSLERDRASQPSATMGPVVPRYLNTEKAETLASMSCSSPGAAVTKQRR